MSIGCEAARNVYFSVAQELLLQPRHLLPVSGYFRKSAFEINGRLSPGCSMDEQGFQKYCEVAIRQWLAIRGNLVGQNSFMCQGRAAARQSRGVTGSATILYASQFHCRETGCGRQDSRRLN